MRLSLNSFLLYSIISVLSVPVALTDRAKGMDYLLAIYAGVGITTFSGLFLFSTMRLLGAIRRTSLVINPFQTLGLITLAGAFRGLLMFHSIELIGLEHPADLVTRILNSTFSTLFWLTIISIVVEESKDFRQSYSAILRSAILKRIKKKNAFKVNQLEVSEEVSRIQELLNRTLDSATRSSFDKNALFEAAQEVRAIVENNVRPLSHKLWNENNSTNPKVRPLLVISEGLRNLNISPFLAAILSSLIATFNISTSYGLIRGLFGAASILVIIYLYFNFINKLKFVVIKKSLVLNFSILILPGLILAFYFYEINILLFDDNTKLLSLVFVPLYFPLFLAISIYSLNRLSREELIFSMQQNLLDMKGKTFLEDEFNSRQMASYLHNSLQSELLAISYQMEEIANDDNPGRSKMALENLGSRINRSISTDFENFLEYPLQRLKKLENAWRGLVDLNINLGEELLNDQQRNYLLVQIIEEAISNSVRHSKAKRVSIRGNHLDKERIKIEIWSDGQLGEISGKGLGTEWLDTYVPGNWQRIYEDNSIRLEIIL